MYRAIVLVSLSVFGMSCSATPWSDGQGSDGPDPSGKTDDVNGTSEDVTYLSQEDFAHGTVQLIESGKYALAEDISFNPHPPGSLGEDGVTVLDAYSAGRPFRSQYGVGDGQYDPAAYGIGFFAAIAISGENIDLDLNGFTIAQSPTHALLQRFFAVIELADQPFVPGQGPSGFGQELVPARRTSIRNGTIGLSSHHGIHGNNNSNILIENVDFEDFEVAAVALNGVTGLRVVHSNAKNRDDVPVIGTFSNALFIAPYVDWLVQTRSPTTLTVQGELLDAAAIQSALRTSVNNVYEDVVLGREGYINESEHPDEYALFHNKFGILDGNSYGYLINSLGAAVGGFPSTPSDYSKLSKNILFKDVHIARQHAFVNEVIALANDSGGAVIDPIGAVFMVRNTHPDTGALLTITSEFENEATYRGNVLANAQALVAKAAANGEFPSFLDVSRTNISAEVLAWIEEGETLDTLVQSEEDYRCNGDTMFHVNKGVIGFRMDGVLDLVMENTSARDISNFGAVGSSLCGDYDISHPDATLSGYGGAVLRGYSFAGAKKVKVSNSLATRLTSSSGTVIGFDMLTNSNEVDITSCEVTHVAAGMEYLGNGGPNDPPDAVGFQVGAGTKDVNVEKSTSSNLQAFDATSHIRGL